MIEIRTKKYVQAAVEAPPSKSYTNRALVIASLANGKSLLKNALFSDDTEYMISALKQFGIRIERRNKDIFVHGTGGRLRQPKSQIFVGNAGTAMRFLTALSSLAQGKTAITGDKRMQQRPIKDLVDGMLQLGVKSTTNSGFPPVEVYGGTLKGGNIKLKGNVSSQYLSAILMCSPYAKEDVSINILGKLTSKPYIDVTIDIMKDFGIPIKNSGYKRFSVKAGRKYKSRIYKIEGDASNASYFFAAAAITKGKVKVNNINPGTRQGDIKLVELLGKMGCGIRKGKDFIEVHGHSLKSIDVDMNDMPDVVPTLAVTSLFADSTTNIRNVLNLRVKETDRLRALAIELRKIGAHVKETEDGLEIRRRRLHKAIIETYNDHRMAMSFAVAGLAISGVRIKNPACVNKSFPGFWKKFGQFYKK